MGVKGLKRFTGAEDATLIRLERMGKSVNETAEIMGRNPKSVRNRIAWLRARGILPDGGGDAQQVNIAEAVAVVPQADPIAEIRGRIADLRRREAELSAQLDDVRDEMAGVFAALTELIGAAS